LAGISIVADVPSDDPRLGFENYADALAAAVRGGVPAQFTLGIYGPWGSGKSSLLNALRVRLDGDDDVIPVFFDAWRYQKSEHIIVPLMHSIYSAGARRRDQGLVRSIGRALVSLAASLKFKLGPVEFDLSGAEEAFRVQQSALDALDAAFERPFADMANISRELGTRRIVVLIDDLDRCSPAKVVDVLEAINLVMDVRGFVFVLALDYDVLVEAVRIRYPHTSGHVFIEKMVQVPFRVPRLVLARESFLADLVPQWRSASRGLGRDFAGHAYDVATIALDANPRQIKRFLNSVLVISRVAESAQVSFRGSDLAGLVGLQLRWPEQYQDLADSVSAGDADAVGSLATNLEDDSALARYIDRFFRGGGDTTARLRELVHLTSVIALPEVVVEEVPAVRRRTAEEIRTANRATLEEALDAAGYGRSNRTNRGLYYHPQIPDSRIVFGKTVVRVESKDTEGEWALVRSYLLTSGAATLLEIVQADPTQLMRRVGRG
jgi:hypothetical protein